MQTIARGRDIVTGLPKEVTLDDTIIHEALIKSSTAIADAVRTTIESAPPELVADIMQKGIVLAGGGALLRGLDQLIGEITQMPVYIADDPLTCVVRGTGIVLEHIDELREVLVNTSSERPIK